MARVAGISPSNSTVRSALLLALICLVCACAPRGNLSITGDTVQGTTEQRMFVATTRQAAKQPHDYNSLRTSTVSLARYDISFPPTHEAGRIEWPKGTPDPSQHVLTKNVVPYTSSAQFTAAIKNEDRRIGAQNQVVVYIQGYNNTFAEGLYRWAQVAADTDLDNVAIHYSWPSTSKAQQYARDRDSIMFARDGLEALLESLARADVNNIVFVAHSLGAGLLMETLRQMSLQPDDQKVLRRIKGVVLISPDLDVNIFETQLRRLNPIPRPFIVFGARSDKALRLSALLTGHQSRLGLLTKKEIAVLKRYNISFVNVSDVSDGEGFLNHSVAITSPTILSILKKLPRDQPQSLQNAGAAISDRITSAIR